MTHVYLPQRSASIPTLRQLNCFKQAAEHATFTQAAQSIDMSQPAFSSAIRELELTLGVTLFDRSIRRVRLTPAGESVRSQVNWIIATFDQGLQDMLKRLQYQSHVIRVHCIPSFWQWIAPHMARFQQLHPEVHFRLDDKHSDDLLEAMLQGHIDIAVGPQCHPPADIDSRLIRTDEILIAISKRHSLTRQSKLHWLDLRDQALVVLQRGSAYESIASLLQEQGLDVNRHQNLSSIESLYAMVHNNLKIGVISELNKQAHWDPELCYLPVTRPQLARKICLMKHAKRAEMPLLVQSFWDMLCDTL
jgi:LysR family carnitine catabolism transcriptional activator